MEAESRNCGIWLQDLCLHIPQGDSTPTVGALYPLLSLKHGEKSSCFSNQALEISVTIL